MRSLVEAIADGVGAAAPDVVFDELAERLHAVVPFDASLFFGIDPATLLATCPARIDGVANNECHSYWEREFLVEDINLFRDLARAPRPANGLWAASEELPARSARYREFLRPEGFGDELRVAFRVGSSTWGVASLMRGAGRPTFTPRELDLVNALSEPVGRTLRSATLTRPVEPPAPPAAPGLMIFDPDGNLLSTTAEADAWLVELATPPIGPRPHGKPLPMALVGVVARARAVSEGTTPHPARGRVRALNGRWLVIHAAPLRERGGDDGAIAVVVEPAHSEEIAPIIVEAYALTPREQQVTQLIARGATTAEIAASLYLSPHTVRDYVKTVFDKVRVSTRGELVAKLFAEHYARPLHMGAYHVDGE
jgi:DNA-binding CsgD family transcriptional regulator